MYSNEVVLHWLSEVIELTEPKDIVYLDGSEEEYKRLIREAIESSELIELNQDKLPGCFYHRSNVNDVARSENLTFICTDKKEDAGPTNNWMNPKEAYKKLSKLFKGSMRGRTMYVIPYLLGPKDSPFTKVGFEVTDSIYVALSMRIMTKVGQIAIECLGNSKDFVRGLHSKGDLDPNKRFICHFPNDTTIWSIGSDYGGNALLSKKCFSLRIASFIGKKEGWLAEHMMILGIENPQGDRKYIAAAFPSSCGKTNLAMLNLPEIFKKRGYKVWTVGDDIAWLRIGDDGRLWAVNPENGFFGVAPGTSMKSNPNAFKMIQKDTIFTNVALKKDLTVWWEGIGTDAPDDILDWKGDVFSKDSNTKAAHPNSRFTTPAKGCPIISDEWQNPNGVPISAILFGGRRAKLCPIVFEAFDFNHGVFMGATMASETTAAATGTVGTLRRDPMAMLPFCGYNMADYFSHWIDMGKKMSNPPKIYNVNWFRTDENGNYIWPGFGENFRIIKWILDRCHGDVSAIETKIGYVPSSSDVEFTGLSIDENIGKIIVDEDVLINKKVIEKFKELISIDENSWREEILSQDDFFNKFESLPLEIQEERLNLKNRLRIKELSKV